MYDEEISRYFQYVKAFNNNDSMESLLKKCREEFLDIIKVIDKDEREVLNLKINNAFSIILNELDDYNTINEMLKTIVRDISLAFNDYKKVIKNNFKKREISLGKLKGKRTKNLIGFNGALLFGLKMVPILPVRMGLVGLDLILNVRNIMKNKDDFDKVNTSFNRKMGVFLIYWLYNSYNLSNDVLADKESIFDEDLIFI